MSGSGAVWQRASFGNSKSEVRILSTRPFYYFERGILSMALFGAKNYASIVAPLKKMVDDLQTYISEQTQQIAQLELQKAKIEDDIDYSNTEIMKSNSTSMKIHSLLSDDLDEDGTPDVDELPVSDSTS